MEIAILIIVSLTIIAVCAGLFLNHKNNLKTISTIISFQETAMQNIAGFKTEIIDKIQQLNIDTTSKIETSKIEFITIVKNGIEKVQGDISEAAKTIDNKISSSKTEILTTITPTLNNVRDEIQTTSNKLQKEIVSSLNNIREEIQTTSNKLHTDIDNQLKNNLQKQNEFIIEVNGKFNKIIEEIKSPLTLD